MPPILLFLNESMSESFLLLPVSDSFPINMMGNFVDEDIIKVKAAQAVKRVKIREIKRVGEQENAGVPIHPIATELAPPGFLLLARSAKQKYGAQIFSRRFRDSFESRPYFRTRAGMNEIRR